MTPQRQALVATWQSMAVKIITVVFPFVVGTGVWVVSELHGSQERIAVIEESRRTWIERFVETSEKTEKALERIDDRLRAIEIRLGVAPK